MQQEAKPVYQPLNHSQCVINM